MEGLEISEANYAQLERTLRVDAEYFRPECLDVIASLKQIKTEKLTDSVAISDGNHFSISDEFCDVGIPYFRGQDVVANFFIEQANPALIPQDAFEQKHMHRSHLKKGDVLLSIVGTIGEASLFTSADPATCSCKLAILRPAKIPAEYLATFLRSRHGYLQVCRLMRGAIQMSLLLEDMDQIMVPRFSGAFEKAVVTHILNGKQQFEIAQIRAEQAEQTLLKALDLEDWQPPEPLTYTRRASEALAAGRLDAEHFQPKFSALTGKMKAHVKVARLGDCLRFCERGRQPNYAEDGLRVINSRHVRTNNVVIDEDNRCGIEDPVQLKLPEEDRLTIRQGDLLINGTGVGTMGRCAPYMLSEKALPDNHVTIIRPKDTEELDPIFLSVQLNSIIGQMQVEQYFKGSSGQIELYPSEIKEFRIWLAPVEIQKQIAQCIQSAHAARREAQELLERAKRAVEIAIEEDELAALKSLKG